MTNPTNKIILTQEQEAYLRENYATVIHYTICRSLCPRRYWNCRFNEPYASNDTLGCLKHGKIVSPDDSCEEHRYTRRKNRDGTE